MLVAVTGGNGFVGSALLPGLLDAGHDVVLLVRNIQRARDELALRLGGSQALRVLDRLNLVLWNPGTGQLPHEALSTCEAVVHLAGENIGKGRWTTARKQALRASRVEGTSLLASSLPPSIRHFICASAVGIYPQPAVGASLEQAARLAQEDFAAPGPEASAERPFLEQLVADWEHAARAASQPGRRIVNLRIGIALGSEGFLAELVPLYRLGLGGPVGPGRGFVPWIHVDDLVAAILWILRHPHLEGPVNVVGPSPVPFRELSASLARALHRPHLFRVPVLAVRLALGEKAFLATASCAAQPTKLLASGFVFRFRECSEALVDVVSRWPGRC